MVFILLLVAFGIVVFLMGKISPKLGLIANLVCTVTLLFMFPVVTAVLLGITVVMIVALILLGSGVFNSIGRVTMDTARFIVRR